METLLELLQFIVHTSSQKNGGRYDPNEDWIIASSTMRKIVSAITENQNQPGE